MKPGQDNRKAPMQNLFFGLTGEELGSAVGCEQSLGLTLCLSSAFFTDSVLNFVWQEQLSGQSYCSSLTEPFLPELPQQMDVSGAQQGCSLVTAQEFSDAPLALGQLWG